MTGPKATDHVNDLGRLCGRVNGLRMDEACEICDLRDRVRQLEEQLGSRYWEKVREENIALRERVHEAEARAKAAERNYAGACADLDEIRRLVGAKEGAKEGSNVGSITAAYMEQVRRSECLAEAMLVLGPNIYPEDPEPLVRAAEEGEKLRRKRDVRVTAQLLDPMAAQLRETLDKIETLRDALDE